MSNTYKRALIGHTDSVADNARLAAALLWMVKHASPLADLDPSDAIVDLGSGRDFLAESATYDVVILQHLFRFPPGHPLSATDVASSTREAIATSDSSSVENWQARLVSTGASLIFVFGGPTEVSAQYLNPIAGYTLVTDDGFGVFEKTLATM